MERNTLLAIILAAAVLFSYNVIFPAPKHVETINNSQIIAAQDIGASIPAVSPAMTGNDVQPTGTINKTVDYNIKTTDTDFSYTNVGGSLHNINFLKNNEFPITDVLSVGGIENARYAGQELNDQTVSLVYRDKNWQITKVYELKDKNLINVRMEIKNLSGISILNNFNFTAFEIDESKLDISQSNRENALFEYSVYANNKMFRKGNATKFNDKSYKSESARVGWVGFRDHYHAFVVKPEFETKGYEIKSDSEKQLNVSIKPQDKSLAPGESVTYNFSVYAGPQNPWEMKKYGKGFEKVVASQ